MMSKIFSNKIFIYFVLKFIFIFCFIYFGTKLIIGLSNPGGFYSQFIHNYFDYVSWIKSSLMNGAQLVVKLFGYNSLKEEHFILRIANGRGVIISQGCVGYGVMSFWCAFILSSQHNFTRKTIWCISGLLIIWMINVIRIGLFLIAINKGWKMPLGIDHHTWFNIFAYTAIFLMIFFYEKSITKNES